MKLCASLSENMQIPDILIEVIDVLLHQDEYRKEFSLVALATIIRESFVLIQQDDDIVKSNVYPNVDVAVLNGELQSVIKEGVNKIHEEVGLKYLEKGKINEEELYTYLKATEDILHDEFGDNCSKLSQFDHLKRYINDLEYDNFRENHRTVLEYMVKLVRTEVVDTFRKDWE